MRTSSRAWSFIKFAKSSLACERLQSPRRPLEPSFPRPLKQGLKENKFGVPLAEAHEVYSRARDMSHVDIRGVACHIGSQLTDTAPPTVMHWSGWWRLPRPSNERA